MGCRHVVVVSTWVYVDWNFWSIYVFGFSKKVIFRGRSGQNRSKLTSLTKTSPKYNEFYKSKYIDRSGISTHVYPCTYIDDMPTSHEMRLYLLLCTSSRSTHMIVGTIACEGIRLWSQYKYLDVRKIKFRPTFVFGFSKKVLFWGRIGQDRSKLTSLTKTSSK